ncbi:DUF2735 domain-containing protein [Aquabacter sp. CN5-332]|uniref:DUF2735 domain-containing protein n=1 Tax=Aquabacter sp. CN5-332 TaxID=3156608 RepID=UPI0032B46829
MTGSFHGGSAKIYQFPKGGRAGLVAQRPEGKPSEDFAALAAAQIVVGDAWYHEAAIKEAEQPRKQ